VYLDMKHVLKNATSANVFTDPFPHVIIENAVDQSLYEKLLEEIPSPEFLAKGKSLGSNEHFVWNYNKLNEHNEVSETWKEFLSLHVQQEFLDDINNLVGEHFEDLHPDWFGEQRPVKEIRGGVRNIEKAEDYDLMLEAQVFVQTPVVGKPDSYRIGHLDSPDKLYNGLFYLRYPEDDSVGANLQLLKLKKEGEFKMFNKLRKLIDDKYLEKVKEIQYRGNTFVLLPNSLKSFHGVQVRQKTKWPRYYMNVLGQWPEPLFDTDKYFEGPVDTVMRRLGLKGNARQTAQ